MRKGLLTFVAVTALVGAMWGWRAVGAHSEPAVAAPSDVLASDAAYRHRHQLPSHWRAYVLQR